MNDNLFAFFVGAMLGFIIASTVFHNLTANRYRLEAVRLGHAEYFLDGNFNSQWRWKTNNL